MRIATALSTTFLMQLVFPAFAGPLVPTGVAHENLRDAAEISGRVVAGVGFTGPLISTPPVATLYVPEAWASEVICLEAVSQDGRYQAQWEYEVEDDWAGGYVTSSVETGYSTFLKEQTGDGLASLVRNESCSSASGAVSPATWNVKKPTANEQTLNVQLNSFRSDEVILILPDGDEIECTPVKESYRIAFDFICALPLASLKSPVTAIEVLRIKSGRVQPVDTFDLIAPEPQQARP